MVTLFCQMRILRLARAFKMIALMTSRPVSSPNAWAIRAWVTLPTQRDVAVDLVKMRAPIDQLADPRGRFADDHFDHVGIAEALASRQGVGDVVVKPVVGIEHFPAMPPWA